MEYMKMGSEWHSENLDVLAEMVAFIANHVHSTKGERRREAFSLHPIEIDYNIDRDFETQVNRLRRLPNYDVSGLQLLYSVKNSTVNNVYALAMNYRKDKVIIVYSESIQSLRGVYYATPDIIDRFLELCAFRIFNDDGSSALIRK